MNFDNLNSLNQDNLANLANLDQFDESKQELTAAKPMCIHIRVQQRNGRKSITTVENLAEANDEETSGLTDIKYLENAAKCLRKKMNCSAAVKKQDKVIQLSGDNRQAIKKYLIENNVVSEESIKVHGF